MASFWEIQRVESGDALLDDMAFFFTYEYRPAVTEGRATAAWVGRPGPQQ